VLLTPLFTSILEMLERCPGFALLSGSLELAPLFTCSDRPSSESVSYNTLYYSYYKIHYFIGENGSNDHLDKIVKLCCAMSWRIGSMCSSVQVHN
jgi:hypothetical protein